MFFASVMVVTGAATLAAIAEVAEVPPLQPLTLVNDMPVVALMPKDAGAEKVLVGLLKAFAAAVLRLDSIVVAR